MLKWKTFIKGECLNEELLSFSDRKISKAQALEGDKVRQIYDEIINEPSTSTSVKILNVERKAGKRSSNIQKSTTPSEVKQTPKPTLLQLMRLCESDDFEKLSREIGDFELNSADEFGWTLLMCAACAGSANCVEFLLKAGANWKLRDKTGNTALNLAQKKRKKAVCEFILDWVKAFKNKEEEKYLCLEENDNGESVKFCESCCTTYTSERIHLKSIAHLVSLSKHIRDKVHYGIPESNKGFQLMLKGGWDKKGGLGSAGQGQKFPVKTVLKRDRRGLGNQVDRKAARITHFAPFDTAAVESPKKEQRLERSRTLQKHDDLRRKSKEKVKEIKYRRELESI